MRTNAGADWQSSVMFNAAAAGAGTGTQRPADYIAVSESTTAPAAGDTTLTGELAGNGWTRAQGTYAHTAGTNVATITRAFTSADPTTRTIAKVAVFNAATGGTMAFVSLLSPTATMVSGDSLTITETFTL